ILHVTVTIKSLSVVCILSHPAVTQFCCCLTAVCHGRPVHRLPIFHDEEEFSPLGGREGMSGQDQDGRREEVCQLQQDHLP
ncbi:hypothetical protein NP493_105g02017, partial [Ridgeia piscesae]